jgi:hypothetical protein
MNTVIEDTQIEALSPLAPSLRENPLSTFNMGEHCKPHSEVVGLIILPEHCPMPSLRAIAGLRLSEVRIILAALIFYNAQVLFSLLKMVITWTNGRPSPFLMKMGAAIFG